MLTFDKQPQNRQTLQFNSHQFLKGQPPSLLHFPFETNSPKLAQPFEILPFEIQVRTFSTCTSAHLLSSL